MKNSYDLLERLKAILNLNREPVGFKFLDESEIQELKDEYRYY